MPPLEMKKLYRFMVNGNLEHVWARCYRAARYKIFRREMMRAGRVNITDAQINTLSGWRYIGETERYAKA